MVIQPSFYGGNEPQFVVLRQAENLNSEVTSSMEIFVL